MIFDAVYITYWSLRDPLCLSQSLPVLRALARGGRRVALITFEQPQWALTFDQRIRMRRDLEKEGVRWEPVQYHKRPRIFSTLFDILLGVWRCVGLAWKGRVRLFHGRGTVAATIAFLASRLTGARFLNDADGPLSEEYVEVGLLTRDSVPYRMTSWAEDQCLRSADAVAVLTEKRRLQVAGCTRGEITVLPCGVDTEHFVPHANMRVRTDLGLDGIVLVYAGKAGGWYLTDAMLDFVKVAGEVLGKVTLLVLTTEDPQHFTGPAAVRGLSWVVRSANREQMPRYLAAGDVGLSFVLPSLSKTACSPVKNGEYLACGLPIVTTAGIGDYSDLVARMRVGIVVPTLDLAGYRTAAEGLRVLLGDPSLRHRCREAARSQVGLSEIVIPRYIHLYEQLLGPSTT